MLTKSYLRFFALLQLGIVAVAVAMLAQIIADSSEMVRVRNSLSFAVGQEKDFAWTPGQEPKGYKREVLNVPGSFQARAQAMLHEKGNPSGNFEKAVALAGALGSDHTDGEPIMSNLENTYIGIKERHTGYCSDYTAVFVALAHAAQVPVREWGFGFDGFAKGHAFVEVYVPELQKWTLLDVFNGFYFQLAANGQPASALEVRDALRDRQAAGVRVVRIPGASYGFLDDSSALSYFARGDDQFYLWWGDDVFTYDSNGTVNAAARLGRAAEQLTAIAIGVQPKMRLLTTSTNDLFVTRLARAKWAPIAWGLVAFLAALQSAVMFALSRRQRTA